MEHIKVARVDNVQLLSRGIPTVGTVHLTAHHLIFSANVAEGQKPREMWVCYPMIHTVERRQPLSLGVEGCALRFRCRDFNFFTLGFRNEAEGKDVFESIQKLTCVASTGQLYAFFYDPGRAERKFNSWGIYQPAKEFARMGLGTKTNEWRVTYINKDFSLCPTYPAILAVPTKISDNVLGYAAKFRSKNRLPVLTYIHSLNQCTITRCSQPLVGIKQSRSIQDEKLITAIFNTTHPEGVISTTPSNLLIDSRPLVNATAQIALGAGTEVMENYKGAKKIYVPIENIHVMRESISKVVEALRDGDASPFPPNRELLAKSNWLRHLSVIIDGVAEVIQTVHVKHSHAVLHCSDGWDRTSQLAALSQICLDPYYRTFEGFMVLVEKDFLSFGHMFAKRSGHLSNEKFFIDRCLPPTPSSVSESPPTSGRSSPSISLPANASSSSPSPSASTSAAAAARGAISNMASRISLKPSNSKPPQMKETSPVFHQFLDAAYQIVYTHPNRFEFNERFLRRLLYHTYSCQYGSFLYDSEKERVEVKVGKKTRCVWDYFLARRREFINPDYDPKLDIGEGVLFPKGDCVRWWAQAWGRLDTEMNGPGRGTNVREDVGRVREERQDKEDKDKDKEREDVQVRLQKIMKTSPRKDLQIFEGVGSSPSHIREVRSVESPLSRAESPLPTGVVASPLELVVTESQEQAMTESQDQFIEVDLLDGKPDLTTDEIPVVVLETNAAAMEASEDSLSGTDCVIPNAVKENVLSVGSFEVELDPLGGGVEMTDFKATNLPFRNR